MSRPFQPCRRASVLGLLVLATLAAPADGGQGPPPDPQASPTIVATWRGGTVSRETYAGWVYFQKLEGGPLTEAALKSRVENMLVAETLADAAVERGTAADPEVRFAVTRGENRALLSALRRHLGRRIRVEDAEIEEQMRLQPELYSRPRKLRLRNLFKSYRTVANEAQRAALRARMNELLTQLMEGADFAEMARRESDSQTRYDGGVVGNVEPAQLAPAIATAAEALEVGELSGVIETEDGLTILRCDEIFEEVKRTPEETREIVSSHLHSQYEQAAWQREREKLLAAASPRLEPGPARDGSAAPETVVASFAGGRLTRAELLTAVAARVGRPDPSALDDEALRDLMEGWVVEVAGADRARELGLDRDPVLREALRWQERKLLAGRELQRQVEEAFEPPTTAEARAYFEANRQRFHHQPRYDLDLISIELRAGDEREHYRQVEELRDRIAAGGLDFETAAREHSEHETASRGGAVGWVDHRDLARLGPRTLKAVTALGPGGVSDPIQAGRFLFILRLRDRREAEARSWEEAGQEVEELLGRERLEKLRTRIEAQLKSEFELELAPDVVSRGGASDPEQ